MHVRDLGTGIAVAVGITVVNTLATSLLAIDDDDFYYRNVLKRAARRHGAAADSDVPGVYFLEIDGLAHASSSARSATATCPRSPRWIRDGSHRLLPWETDWSSQTGACQAGLLHGSNDDMPAFRWWEKEHGRAIVTNHPKDAAEIERRHSDGRGLLHEDGASRANILSGDAPHTLLTMSTVLDRGRPGPPRPGLLRVLLEPVQRHPDPRAGDRRHRPGALLRGAAAPPRRPPADQALVLLRARARLGHGDPARPPGGGGDRRPLRRPPGGVHDVPRLRRGRAPLGRRARRRARRAAPARPPDRAHRRRRRRRLPAVPPRRPLRPRAVPGRDLPRPLREDPRGPRRRGVRDRAMSRPRTRTATRRSPTSAPRSPRRAAPRARSAAASGAATRSKRVDGEVVLGEDRERERERAAEDDEQLPRALGDGLRAAWA